MDNFIRNRWRSEQLGRREVSDNAKRVWAGIVLVLLLIIAGSVLDIALILEQGISVEYVTDVEEGE